MTLQSDGPPLDAEVRRLGPWFHNLHLPGGRQTAPDHPLGDFPSFKWAELSSAVPEDLRGARALDVGCNAGFYSFELARRGADVLAIDPDPHYLRQAAWAAERLGLAARVTLRRLGVYDLVGLDETFDLVLFMGVLYHLRHPLLALDLVAEHTRSTLVVQTLTVPDDAPDRAPRDLPLAQRGRLREPGWPTLAFVEHHLAGDPTNWWVPNASAVEAMIRSSGMRIVDRPGHELWVCQPAGQWPGRRELRAATGRLRPGAPANGR
ncbi:MAG: Methyltransferase type 11 [Acidimicrobiales bacterium]|nr:Methyltransferase type 11 [Acidimicrobiales bacterium]